MLINTRKELICSRISTYKRLEYSVGSITDEAKRKLIIKKKNLLQDERKLDGDYYCSPTEDIEDKLFRIGIELEHLYYELETIIELEIMYIYKSYEYNLKRIICWSFPELNINNRSDISKIISLLKTKGIEFKQCNNFYQVDTLRGLNNKIKHNGSLQKKDLQKIQCDDIYQLSEYIAHIKPEIESFLEHFIERISKKIMLNNSSEMNRQLEGLEYLSIFATSGGRYT